MDIKKLKQLALLEQIGGPQQPQEDQSRMAMGLIQALMQQQGEAARLGVQQAGMEGDQRHQAAMEAFQKLGLESQIADRTANDQARGAQDWYQHDRYVTDAANRTEDLRLRAADEQNRNTTNAEVERKRRNVDIYKTNQAGGMDPRAAAVGLNDPELQAAGVEAQKAAVSREAAKWIAMTSMHPPALRQQMLNEAMGSGMHPETRAIIDAHFGGGTQPNAAPGVTPSPGIKGQVEHLNTILAPRSTPSPGDRDFTGPLTPEQAHTMFGPEGGIWNFLFPDKWTQEQRLQRREKLRAEDLANGWAR